MREINSLNFAEELKSPLWSRTWENPTDRLLSSIVLRRAQINSLWGSQKYVSIVLGMLIGMALIDLIQETETEQECFLTRPPAHLVSTWTAVPTQASRLLSWVSGHGSRRTVETWRGLCAPPHSPLGHKEGQGLSGAGFPEYRGPSSCRVPGPLPKAGE